MTPGKKGGREKIGFIKGAKGHKGGGIEVRGGEVIPISYS